jgi:dihydrofolate reductase
MFHLTIKMMQTLDGFIAQNQNDKLLWGSNEDKQLYKKVSTQYGTVIVGKNTYLQMPKIAFKNRDTIVAVRNLTDEWIVSIIGDNDIMSFDDVKFCNIDNVTFIESNPVTIINFLESLGKSKALLVGGGIINNLFLQARVVNELQITIAPKVFGSGIKIFGNNDLELDLELQDFEKISTNELVLTYKVCN